MATVEIDTQQAGVLRWIGDCSWSKVLKKPGPGVILCTIIFRNITALSRAQTSRRRGRSLTSRNVGRSIKIYSPHLQNLLKQRLWSQQPTLYKKPGLEETWSWSQLVHDHGHEVFYCGVCRWWGVPQWAIHSRQPLRLKVVRPKSDWLLVGVTG